MALDIEKARAAGYSEAEIVDYLGKDSTLDIGKARAAGYDNAALIKHLSAPKQETPKPAAPAAPPVATGPKGKDTTQLSDDDETGNFMRGIYNYLPQLQETYGGAKVFAGMGLKKLGATETGQELIESGKESMDVGESKQLTRESDSLTKAFEKGIGTVVTDWLPYNIGSGIANIGETLAFMGIGAGVGAVTGAGVGAIPGAISGAISKTLVKKGIKEAAETIIEAEAKKAVAAGATKQAAKAAGEVAGTKFIEAQSKNVLLEASEMAAKAYGKAGAKSYGATAAMVGQAGLHGTGETTSRAVNEAERAGMDVEDIDYGRLATAAAVHSVADFFINKIGVNALKIGEQATQSLILDIGKRIAVTGLKEIPAEEIQTMAERYGANLSLTDAEALREYVDTAGAAFAMSVGPGTVGGAKTHYVNKLKKAGAEAETAGQTYKGDLTVNKDVVPPTAKGFDKESADLLMPASDAAGKPIVANVAAAEVTEATPAPKKPRTSGVALDSIEAATDYVQALDAGTKKPNTMQVNALMKTLGIAPPEKGEGYLGRSVAAVKARLAEQGAPDATGTNIEAGGGGPDVAALTDTEQAAAGDAGSQSRGMVSTRADAGPNLARTGPQPPPLISPVSQRIITDEYNAGATPAELITKYGGTPEAAANIDTFIKSLPPQGTTDGTATSQAKQTKAQGQASATRPAAGSVSLGSLAPEIQEDIQSRRDTVYEMVSEGAGANKIANAYKALNALEERLGLDITKPTTLSAKRDKQGRLKTQDLVDEGGQATATEQDRTPGYQGDDLQEAMNLADKYDKQEEQEKQKAYEESLGKGESRYDQDNLPSNAEENYDAVAEELNAKAETANETRKGLAAKVAGLTQQHRDAVNEVERLEDAIDAAERNNDQKKLATLREQESEANSRESNLLGDLIDSQTALQGHGVVQNQLKPWRKLDSTDKDIYFGYIRKNTPAEHRQAAAALLDAKNKAGVKSREGEGKMDAAERRAAQNYEDNRAQMSKLLGVQFPAWEKLSPAAKAVYLREIVNNAGQQQDVAFAKLGVKLVQDNKALSEQEKKRDQKNITDRQEEVRRKSEEQNEKDRKTREAYERNKPSASSLPNSVIQMIMNSDLQGVLDYMSNAKLDSKSAPTKRIMKAVAQALAAMKLNTKIQIVEASKIEGDLAQYDPVKDVIYITREGLSSNTILHEIIHAGTVKVINEYLYGNKGSLSQLQLAGVRQLERIMEETRGSLAVDHPEAYRKIKVDGKEKLNLFEFVSYALTSAQLQQDLHDESVAGAGAERLLKGVYGKENTITETIGKILPTDKSQWSKFKLAIARILKVRDEYLTKGKLDRTADTNYLMEIAAAFEDILVKPTEPIYLPVLPAKKAAAPAKAPKQAPKFQTSGLYEKDKSYKLSNKEKHGLDVEGDLSTIGRVKRAFSRHGWRDFVTKVQSRRHHIRAYENELAMAGLLVRDPTLAFNNVSEKQDLAINQGVRYAIDYLQQPLQKLHESFSDWLTSTNQNTEAGLEQFHKLGEMFGATEKRFTKWLMFVPLSKIQNLIHNGKPISAAERRIALVGDPRTGVDGLIHRVKLNAQQMAAINKELEYLATNHNDPFGDSPRISEKMRIRFAKPGSKHKGLDVDMDKPIFNALGIEKVTVDKRMAEFLAKSPEEQALIKEIFAQVKIVTDATAKLNEIGNYWSMPVSNIVGIYNYQYYMPFKGLSKHSKADDMIDPNSKMNGAELQDEIHSAEGRFSTSDNPLLQTIYDGYRAASRAGRKDFTQAVENAVEPTTKKDAYNPTGTGIIVGRVVKTVPFWERDTTDLSKYKGANSKYMFNYKADGSMNIIAIDNPKLLQAIRYPFQEKTPLWDAANRITGFFGSMHTRFNYNFAPKDFVVNTLTNAWVGATNEIVGPLGSVAYLKDVAMSVARNGLSKAMNIAVLHEIGNAGSKKIMSDMAAKDSFVRDMLEMIRYGGKSTYMESFSLKSNLENLSQNSFGKNNIITDPISATKLLDSWNNMFEFTSRTAMYSLYKERVLKQNIAKGMSDKKGPNGELSPAERAAAEESAAFTLNLANFSQQGEWGKIMGGLYMFIKPSSTGAVRALEAVMPAFTTVKRAMQDLPPVIENNPTAKAKYQETFEQRQFNARVMTTTLIAAGMGLFELSMMGAPDDEWERNAARTDNMEQWTRYARFHIPNEVSERIGLGKDIVFQIPWGFGPGAFAAAGAQFAAMLAGTISPWEAFSNTTFTVMTDAFLPLPMSKIPITDAKTAVMWSLDSVAPSTIRPFVEWIANVNGIGQAINSASQRRMGDAYTGGDRIPEIYKDVADGLFEATEGYIDWSPNTMYFFTNSYLDGVAKIAELGYSWTNLGKGEKEFNAKTDLPLFGSFFGAKTNVDSREYGKIEQKIKDIDKRLYTLDKRNPVLYAEFVAKNPLYPSIVEQYQSAQGELNEIRKRAFEIRNNKYLAIKDRDALLKLVTLEQNMLKHRLVEDFKAMGLER
jgi:hypothetical protein